MSSSDSIRLSTSSLLKIGNTINYKRYFHFAGCNLKKCSRVGECYLNEKITIIAIAYYWNYFDNSFI